MKKQLVLIALSLVIVGSMLSGTLAQYVKTSTVSGNVEMKKFEFVVAGNQGNTFNFDIAPGISKTWFFDIYNYNGDNVSETDMVVSLSGSVGKLPKGFVLELKCSDTKYYGDQSDINAGIPVIARFPANTPSKQRWLLTADWQDAQGLSTDAEDTEWQGRTIPVTITLTARQD